MKALFVSLKHSESGSGGKVITRRNRFFIEKYFGSENVIALTLSSMIKRNQREAEIVAERNGVDVVFLDASSIGFFSNEFYKRYRVITFFHNVEANYCDAEQERSVIMRMRSILIKKIEKQNCRKSFKIISLNERDSSEIERIYGRSADYILHSSMKDECIRHFSTKAAHSNCTHDEDDYILFVGTDFFGNTDGLFRFIETCMKQINCRLKVVGTGMDKYKDRYDDGYKTEFVGYVDDLGDVYANAVAVVMPIISGSGMKTKTCEALMHGKFIFGTDEAFEGYDISDSDCITCNSEKLFVKNINAFLETAHSFYSERNRRLFLEKYENVAVYEPFKTFMDSCITIEE